MSVRASSVVALALLAAAARPASAADSLLERIARAAEARLGQQGSGEELALLARELETQDRAQRAEFANAAARPLPAKARARLEATRQAWAAGQGRLLELLRPSATESARAGSTKDLLRLARELREPSRREPLSAGELKTRIPTLQPPALARGPARAAASGDPPPIGPIAAEIRQRAAELAGPIEAYEWVRNGVRPELYHGVMKGPRQTLFEMSGNDADTAGLLIAILRAKGIPARYVRGTVQLPAAVAAAVTGTASAERALRAYAHAGIPNEPVMGSGGVSAIRIERVWAEAYLPYANYRGALLDAHEKAWVPLDAGFKRLAAPGGFDVRTLGFDPIAAFDEYLELPTALTPREYLRQRVETILAAERPDLSYEEVLARRDVLAQNLGLLPGTLPYGVVARAEVDYDAPEALVHTVRFVLESGSATLLDGTFPVANVLGQRLTVSYVPFDEEDEEVVRLYGGLFRTPPYLVEVRPVLKLAGIALASGTLGVGLGVTVDFRIELTTPGGHDTVTNRVLAGNMTAIGLAAGRVTGDVPGEDEAARILARLAFHYLDRWNRSDDELGALLRVVAIRPLVSTCLVQSAVEVEYAGGDPLYPIRYDWKGLAIDADRRPTAPVALEGLAAERDFLLASGLEGSVLEHRIFEDDWQLVSVSTAKALQLARQRGVEVHDLGPGDDGVLEGLPLDAGVKQEIREALMRGLRARVPAGPLDLLAWTGVGYLILDPETGESAWQLQGGHSGGVTAPAVIDIPEELVDVIWQQSETPSPGPSSVSTIQKFDTTNYQLGTVDTPLTKAFKVLVTDVDGFPVAGAPVTFSAIGGGGSLIDPVAGGPGQAEVTVLSCAGGEREGPCASLKPGEAVAILRLGRHTGEIPRYVCEEPFTCRCPEGVDDCDPDQVGYMTQTGLNLVTVRSGQAVLAEPFMAFGFPERLPVEGVPGAIQAYFSLAAVPQYNPANLTVPDWLRLAVTDRHANPISNLRVRVAFRPDPVLAPIRDGWSLLRGPNQTPGHVLRAWDYGHCVEDHYTVIWGECPGEATSVETLSSSSGATVYPVNGDSPWSYYYFDYGSTLQPNLGWVAYRTDGRYCPAPDPHACGNPLAPETFLLQGTRATTVNTQGNSIEAYAPGAAAELGAWVDVVWEEADVRTTVDTGGVTHYWADGANSWRRERLTDSTLRLTPTTPGTQAAAQALHVANGRYTAVMTMAAEPQENVVKITGTHLPPQVKYLPGGDVDPETIEMVDGVPKLRRVKDPARPVTGIDEFSLWGVEPRITEVQPTPVVVDAGGTVTRVSLVRQSITPPEYQQLLEPRDIDFELRAAADDSLVLAANGTQGEFRIPSGLALPARSYYGRVAVAGVQAEGGDLTSEAFPVPVCSLLDLHTPKVEIAVVHDPVNNRSCGAGKELRFSLCRPAIVTFTVAGAPFTGSLDREPPRLLTDVALSPGLHTILLPPDLPDLDRQDSLPFALEAHDAEDPTQSTIARGLVVRSFVNQSSLPVGRTFVKGVDLLDGHLVQQSTDLKVPGRHLGLELTRTYSSAGWRDAGPLGGGWSLNYGSRLFEDGDCGIATVVTADGSSQVFQSGDGLLTFTAQKGYHTRLERDGTAYRFIDKAGNVHRFEEQDQDLSRRLLSIEEPHGDRLVFSYDGAHSLTKVAEVQAEAGEVRALQFHYRQVQGIERVERAEIPALGLAVSYEYDERGNLTTVTRDGANVAGSDGPAAEPRVERYEYRVPPPAPGTGGGANGIPPIPDARKDHQLIGVIDPNGDSRRYVYFGDEEQLPGEVDGRVPAGLFHLERWELVKQVVEHPAPAISIRTEFSYDARQALARAEWTTTVRDGRGQDSVYLLNGNGSPLRIDEPLGKTTRMTWAANDIHKVSEIDANGRTTKFGYDAHGNLTLETIETQDRGDVVTTYAYDPAFNKLTYKKDAEGRETRYDIDPETGDLRETLDAVGNRTVYGYDEHGRLQTVTDPRGNTTTHRGHDSFGNAAEVVDLLGNVTRRAFDLRGRLLRQTDTWGRDALQTWDGLDRLVRTVRVAGSEADNEVTSTEYFPRGDVRLVRNALGAVTNYTVDGLGRVTGTTTTIETGVLTSTAAYDPNGNKESETDRRGVTRLHTYDALNRLVETKLASGGPGNEPEKVVASFGYDAVGNKLWEKDHAGRQTDFEYDGLYRVKTKWLPATMPAGYTPAGRLHEEYVYDKVGNLTSQKDANGKVSETQYDGLNRPTQVTRDVGGLALVTTAVYNDPEGSHVNKSEEQDVQKGLRTTFAYDELGREDERKVHIEGEDGDPTTGVVTYTTATAYADELHTVRVTDARGVVTSVKLDGLDRETQRTVDEGVNGLSLVTITKYDGAGNKTLVTDPRDKSTSYRYDELGRLLEVTDALQHAAKFTHDGEGLKTSEEDRRGVKTLHTYDNLGRLRTSRLEGAPFSNNPWSREIQYTDSIPAQRHERDANNAATNKWTVFELDGLDRVVRVTDPAPFQAQTVETTWDGVNRRLVRDKRGNGTSYEYDGVNRLTKATDPAPFQAQTVETTYQDSLNRVTEKDRRGTLNVTQTDPLGRVVKVTAASGTPEEAVLERNSYDALGNKVLATDGEGKKTRFTYDNANRLSSQTDGFETADAATTEYRYDANGNRTKLIDPRSSEANPSAEYAYDELNRVTDEWDGERNRTQYRYDENGNRTHVRAPKQVPDGPSTAYEYDELGKLTKVTQLSPAVGEPVPVTQYAYDPNRNHITQTDAIRPNGRIVAMEYDQLNRLKKTTQDPGGLALVSETTRFDANGNPEERVDPKGQKVTSTFDALNRTTGKTYGFAPGDPGRPWRHTVATGFSYDANGNLLQADEQVAEGTAPPSVTLSTVRTYDLLNRLTSETLSLPDGGTRAVGYTYYNNGARKTVTDAAGAVTQYAYDGQNRLRGATLDFGTPQAQTTDYGYWPDDLLHTVSYPDGVVGTHSYDAADRLLNLTSTRDSATVTSYVYTYDLNGNRLTQAETNGGATEATSYTYDDLDRLKTITYPVDASYPNGRVVSYGYDAVGNRVHETERDSVEALLAEKQGVFDNANRLTTLTDLVTPADSTSFTWDPNGNQISKTVGTGPNAVTRNVYDVRDKLAEVQSAPDLVSPPTSILARFQYDAEGRLIKKIGEEGIRQYVYDQTSRLAEYDASPDPQLMARFSYGSDRLISMWHLGEGMRFYHLDGLRSVTALTDSAGAVTARLRLDTWGNFRFPADLTASANRFAFTGHVFDTETGLYYAKARYFDPKLGRFLTQDSFLGSIDEPPSLHRYTYAADNPTRFVDPTGHFILEGMLGKQLEKVQLNLVGNSSGTGWGSKVNFAANATLQFAARGLQVPTKFAEGMANVITPGGREYWTGEKDAEPAGWYRESQRQALNAAANPNLSPLDRGLNAAAAVLSTPAVVIEETVVAPAMKVPQQASDVGVHIAQAENTSDPVQKTVHYLEAVKSGSEAAGTMLGLAVGLRSALPEPAPTAASLSDRAFVQRIATKAESTGVRLGKGAAGTGPEQGIWKHDYANRVLKRYQRTTGEKLDLVSEESYLNKGPASYGDAGSSRPDVFNPSTGQLLDYKFVKNPGKGLRQPQMTRNLKNVPGVKEQIEINP